MSCAMPVSPCVLQHVKSVSKEAGRDLKLDSIYSRRSRTFNTYWHNYPQTDQISGVFSSGLGDITSCRGSSLLSSHISGKERNFTLREILGCIWLLRKVQLINGWILKRVVKTEFQEPVWDLFWSQLLTLFFKQNVSINLCKFASDFVVITILRRPTLMVIGN